MSEIPSLKFDIKKDAWQQLQSGSYKVAITISPADLDDNRLEDLLRFMRAPMGQRYAAVLVEIGDDEQPVVRPKDTREADKRSRCQQAGILCKQQGFAAFLREHEGFGTPFIDPDEVAETVRKICGVQSRRELDSNKEAGAQWDRLAGRYEGWLAEARVGVE